ncbi:MAG: hypothetical protein GTO18_13960 [Anaerolineales bacterium]|nr:hypothetical protein [Anaerolineales bacterium]
MKHFIPRIRGDEFRNRTCTEIVPPGEMGCNDHCLFMDTAGRWHCIGIINAEITNGESFFHAVGDSPIQPMRRLDPIYRIREGERTCWAPCNVVVDDKIHFFWTDASEFYGVPQSEDERGIFHQRHATAPLSDVRDWTHHGIVFEEEGGVRDPEVFWVGDRWMMIYCRRVDFGGRYGESVVSYRYSDDLFNWGERAGDLVRGLEDTQWFGSSESPFLYPREEGWYLFVTHVGPANYHRTKVWFSADPTDFGMDEDHITVLFTHAAQVFEFDGKTWITNTGCHSTFYGFEFPSDIGVEVAELVWDPTGGSV